MRTAIRNFSHTPRNICAATALLLLGTVLAAHAQEQTPAAPAPGFSYTAPEGYAVKTNENGEILLKGTAILSAFAPIINLKEMTEEKALEHYDSILRLIQQNRYQRFPKMRLVNKSGVKTSRAIVGWQLSYMDMFADSEETEVATIVQLYLLLLDNNRMLLIEARALFDSRTEFAIVCDQLVNSIAPAP